MKNGTETVTQPSYLTHPALQHLTILPPALQRRSPMMKAICLVLSTSVPMYGRGLTRVDVMKRVHQYLGHPSHTFKPTSNGSYWRRIHAGYREECHDEARYSVILNGLVQVAGKRGRQLTYELTPAGELFARS